MKIFITIVVVVTIGAALYLVVSRPWVSVEPGVCTADARLCPDGSYVSRVAPSCEFAACPIANMPSPAPQPVPSPTPTPEPPPPIPSEVKPEIVRGDTTKKQIIFTFDGGSGAQSGEKILEVLEKHGLTSTFFLTGRFAEENTDLVRTISAGGHEIYNHTYSHVDLTTVSDVIIRQEFKRTEDIINGITGKTTKPYFRPPYGARTLRVREVAAREGYQSVYWTVDVLDWKESEGFTDAQARDRILSNLAPGTIYLMHIGDGITGRILDGVITEIESRGYIVVPLTKGL